MNHDTCQVRYGQSHQPWKAGDLEDMELLNVLPPALLTITASTIISPKFIHLQLPAKNWNKKT